MFLQIFKNIWNNKISKYFLLIALTLLVIGLTLTLKMPIYNFFYRLFVGEVYFDPYTYKNREYGFTEKPEKSEKLFRKGYKKLVKMASELYDIDYSNPILSKEFNHEASWESLTSEESLELVYMLFHDLELFCVPFDSGEAGEYESTERLKKRYSIHRKKQTDSIQFAIKDEEFAKYANELLEIDQNYFFLALQKKPDSIPVLKLREKILRSVCKPQKISVEMTRSLEYHEYKTEKEVYLKFKGNNPDFIIDETFSRLKKDKLYATLLKEQFQNTYFLTKNIADRLQQSYNYYILKHDDYYLENYLTSVLEYSRNSGIKENENIYTRLKLLKTSQTENNSTLLYTMAEVSFRLRKYDDTREYLDKLTLISKLGGHDSYKVKRLYFLLELTLSG